MIDQSHDRLSFASSDYSLLKAAIVGAFSGSHVGGSFARAAESLGVTKVCFDTADAMVGNRILRSLRWRFGDRKPLYIERFADKVSQTCSEERPDVLIATGAAPLLDTTLRSLRALGIVSMNYSTDDPWNGTARSDWHLSALPYYDVVFTTRRSNIDDLRRLGCTDVRYLPFGYDEELVASCTNLFGVPSCDVLFVGGADNDRVQFMSEFVKSGVPVTLVGSYWDRVPDFRKFSLGSKSPADVGALTASARVNLCLVRHANRDGHVMRSFEIAAIGGCALVEDTAEHREIFGSDGECVLFFRSAPEAAERADFLLSHPEECARLTHAVRNRIRTGKHSYKDRFATMLNTVIQNRPEIVGLR